jgi:hypothetical protein
VIFLVNHLMKGIESVTVKDRGQDKSASYPSVLLVRDDWGIWSIAYREDALLLIRVPAAKNTEAAIRKMNSSLMPRVDRPPEIVHEAPEGLVFRKICVQSGLRATSVCPKVIREPFLKGSQPVEWCPLKHGPSDVPSEAKSIKRALQPAKR